VLNVHENFNLTLDIHGSVHRDVIMNTTNEMQLYRLIYFSLLALHVSDDIFARNM